MMAKEPISDLEFVDDLYFSALSAAEELEADDEERRQELELFPVSDVKYAHGLQFQEALMGSVIISQQNTENNKKNTDRLMMLQMTRAEPMVIIDGGVGAGESSHSFCEICVERKERYQMFRMEECVHSICSDCMSKYVETKIHNTSIKNVTCPGVDCKAALQLDTCRSMLPKRVIDLWEDALCQELIGAAQRFYCPFKDCSAMLVNESEEGEVIEEAECPFCHRLFCAQCHVPWHSGVNCEEFQRLNEDERGREDIMVLQLAQESKWGRCPSCKFYVERTDGCPHMTCRCKYEFCYGCGSQWSNTHGGCSGN